MMKRPTLLATAAAVLPMAAFAQDASGLDMAAVAYDGGSLESSQTEVIAALQILLDRKGISPGVIDGTDNPLTERALAAFEAQQGLKVDGALDSGVWSALGGEDAEPYVQDYTITAQDTDVRGEPFPDDYAELAELDYMGFVTTREKLAEEFHMSEDFLQQLNPDAAFSEGETIRVVAPGEPVTGSVARIEVRKAVERVVALDENDTVIASYPAVIGSEENPSPSGDVEVTAVAIEPTYSYRPDENFQQGDNTEPLTLPPGPNGPVGIVWIDLDQPTYGIHGANDPAQIAEMTSHGCVRLLNWDAMELAEMTQAGVQVSFVEGDGSISAESNGADREDSGGQTGDAQPGDADSSDGSDSGDQSDDTDTTSND
ncbi:murein L,D-transpeptidase [Salipiger sp. IMCC34102]|uniref:L,D-transpeptidase family protein n=1 Tax=Salipiger sp. IMCC34102 TaxID=2510647 RepID=UPI00101D0BAE|nr:L,D-transpeptidase [Salipiger sp. IMCC34102]RYH02587.1 murein L,D-transpeptidase [Salipiger sp. IMCC34102]